MTVDATPHILVVDDDERLRRLLQKYLTENGYMVSTAADAAEARAQMAALTFDLMVLDVMMPGESGLDLTQALRAEGTSVPILMLTAMGETEDRINGLAGGADDYLAKPFEPRELLLRIASILRRATSGQAGSTATRDMADPAPTTLHFGAFRYDRTREELTHGGNLVHLTSAEAALLRALAEHPWEVLSRDDLAAMTGTSGSGRNVDVQVTRLRKKLEDDPRLPRYVQTVRGKGYMLRPD